ncbi:MAG TPA: hypothetical protein VJA18_04140 [Candidatus Nanoarchaeia archaeon]|nr:hypothetical protein [Candidatus Nanoarchaeia archaeon]
MNKREAAYREFKQREWDYLKNHPPEDAKNAQAQAVQLGKDIKGNQEDALRIESSLRGTKETPGAEARAAAAKQRYDQLSKEYGPRIEFDRTSQEYAIGFTEESVKRAIGAEINTLEAELKAARDEYYRERELVNILSKNLVNAKNRESDARGELEYLSSDFADRDDVVANLLHAAGLHQEAKDFVEDNPYLSGTSKQELKQSYEGYTEAQDLERSEFLAALGDDLSIIQAVTIKNNVLQRNPELQETPQFQKANDAITQAIKARGEEQDRDRDEQIARQKKQMTERRAGIFTGPSDWKRPPDILGSAVDFFIPPIAVLRAAGVIPEDIDTIDYVGHVGGRLLEKGHEPTLDYLAPAIASTGGVRLTLDALVAVGVLREDGVESLRDFGAYSREKAEQEDKALDSLLDQREHAQKPRQVLQAYADEGLSASEAFEAMETGNYDPRVLHKHRELEGTPVVFKREGLRIEDGNTVVLRELANGRLPEETAAGREGLAAQALQRAENEEAIHGGKAAFVENEFREVSAYSGTVAAAEANVKLEALEETTLGISEKYHQTIVEPVGEGFLSIDNIVTAPFDVAEVVRAGAIALKVYRAEKQLLTVGKLIVHGTEEAKAALRLARTELRAAQASGDVARVEQATERARAVYQNAVQAAEQEAKIVGRTADLGHQVKVPPYRRALAAEHNQEARRLADATEDLQEAERVHDVARIEKAQDAVRQSEQKLTQLEDLDQAAKIADARPAAKRVLGELPVSEKVRDAERNFEEAQAVYNREVDALGEARKTPETSEKVRIANEELAKVRAEDLDNVPPEIADARAQNDLAVEGFADSEHTAAVRQKAAAESNVVQLRKEERPGGAKCNILRAAAIYGLSVDCVDDLDEIDTPTIVPARESGPRVISGQREIPFVSTGDRTHDLYIEAYQEASVSGGVSPEMVKKLKLTDGWTGEGAENVALKIYDEKFLAKINEKRKLAGKPAIKPTFKDPVILKIRKKGAGSYGNTPDWLQKIHGDLCAAKAATCLEEIDLDTGLWQISEEAKGPDLRELIENALDEADQAKLKAIDDRFTMATAEAKKRADEAIPALQKRVSDEKLPGYVYNDELNNIKKNLNDEIKNAAKIASDERQTLLQPYSQTFDAVNYEGRTINVREKTEQLFDKLRKADTEVLDAHWRNLKCIDTDCTRLVVVDLGAATQGDYSTITEEAAKAYARDALLGGNQDISSGIGRLLEQNQYTPGRVSLDEAVGTPHPTICGGAIYPGILVGTAIDTGCGLPGIVEEGIDVPEGYVSLPIEREITDFSGYARVNVQDLSKATPSSAPQKQALEIPSVQRKVVQNVIEAAEKQGENAIITRYQRLSQRIEQGESIVIPKHYHTTSKEGLEGILDSGKIEARRSIAHGAFTSTQPEGAYGDFTFVLGSDIEKLPADVTVFPQRTWYANQEDILVDEKNIAYIIAKDSRADEAREFIHQRNLNIEVVPLSQAQRERRLIIDARMNSPDRANVLLEGSVRINFPQRRRFSDIFPEEASLEQRAAKIFDTLEDGEVIIIQERNYAYISIEGDKKYLSYVDPESRQLNRQPLLATEREADDIFPSNDELFQFQRSVEDLMGANVYRAGVKIDPKVEGQFLEALANGEFSNIRNPRIAPHPTICGGAIYPGILVGTAIDTGCGLPSFADDLEGITEGEFVEEALPPGVPTTIEGIPTPTTSSPEVISPRKLSVEVDLDITIESGKFRLEGKKYTYDPVDGWKGGFFGRKPDAETTARLETARMQNVVNSKPVLKEGQQILIVKRDNSLVAGTFDGIDLDIELKPSPTFGEAKLENGVEVSSGSVNRFSKSSTKDPTLEPRLIIEGDFVRVRTVDGTSTVGRFDGIKGTDFLLTDKTGTKKIPLAELDPSSILKEGDEVVIGVTRPAGYRESAVTEIRGRYFENENSLTLLTDEGVAVLPKENVNVDSLRRAVPEERRVVSPVPETEIEPIDLPSCPIGGALTGKAAAGPCFSARVPRTIADLEKNKIPIQRTPLPQTEETIATVNVQDLSKATPSLGLQTQALEIPSVQQQVIRNVIEEAEQQGQNVIASRYKDLLQKAEQGEKVVVPKHYHGTSKEGLEGILDGGKIEARFEQVYPGAFTSTRPEIGEGTSNFGDFSIALGSDTERLPHVLNPQGDGHAWVSFQDDIPVSENNIAYIIAEDSRVEEARQILEQRNLNIKVIPASEAKKERTLITDARINSPDRANVLFETGLEINSPQKADFFSYFDRKIGLEGSSTNIFDTLEDGEVINIDSQYYYLSIEGDKKFLNTIDLNNRQLTKRQLVATKAEADEIYRPLISKETGKRPRSVQDLVELGVSGDRPKPYRTGVKVNPRSGENFLGSLSDGRTLPLGTEFPPPAIPLGEGVLGVVGKRYSRTPDGINWEQQKRWWEFWRKEETVVDPILIEELNRAEAAS